MRKDIGQITKMSKDWSLISSQVLRTSYNSETKEMIVQYVNAKWAYSDVSLELWLESVKTDSIGKFLNSKIKPDHQATKLG